MSERIRADRWLAAALVIFAPMAAWVAWADNDQNGSERNPLEPFINPTGVAKSFSTAGHVDMDNPFFQSLGTNGRACVTCHQPSTGWTITPAEVRNRFEKTGGLDPIFRTNDGSNSPWADVTTVESRRSAYSMLLNKGLIRVGIGIPAGAEFTLEAATTPTAMPAAASSRSSGGPCPPRTWPS